MIEYKLKPIIDKSWILHNNGNRIAIVTSSESGYNVIGKVDKKTFESIDELANYLNVKISIEENEKEQEIEINDVHGYPIKHTTAFDVKIEKYPSYTKNAGSAIRFAAGYYGLLFSTGWTQAFCPKTTTLDTNEYIGPFRTKLEMQNSILQNRRKNTLT